MTAVLNEKTCFIIALIGEDGSDTRRRSDSLIQFIINPVVLSLGYDPIRADKISEQGVVTNQIIRRIINSPLVIADLTESNPNVFYELAIRHMVRRPVVHLIDEKYKIPFDLAGLRIIKYPSLDVTGDKNIPLSSVLESIDKTKKDVETHIKNMEKDDSQQENPISSALDGMELSGLFTKKKK